MPLAHTIRPETLEEFIGQTHILGTKSPLTKAIEEDNLHSILLYGPPGCGKTTLAHVIAKKTQAKFHVVNAVDSGLSEMREIVAQARDANLFQTRTIVFIDEIHRFNKKQQDFLLPYVEKGTITLIGATTENPSFTVINALLSRMEVFKMEKLGDEHIAQILKRAIDSKYIKHKFNDTALKFISILSAGDARFALNAIEKLDKFYPTGKKLTPKIVQEILQSRKINYDRDGEEHYNLISALHKSMRDSDIQASVYYALRMLEGGEDPLYIVRRMVRFASEDIGLADNKALKLAIAVKQTVEFLGRPECDTALVQLAVYLAKAPKDNRCYKASLKTKETIKNTGDLPVPLHIRNAVTKLMKDWGYGKDYQYAHDYKDAKVEQEHLPEKLKDETFFEA